MARSKTTGLRGTRKKNTGCSLGGEIGQENTISQGDESSRFEGQALSTIQDIPASSSTPVLALAYPVTSQLSVGRLVSDDDLYSLLESILIV